MPVYRKDKEYIYQRQPIVFKGMRGTLFHFERQSGCKVLIDCNHLYLIKEDKIGGVSV